MARMMRRAMRNLDDDDDVFDSDPKYYPRKVFRDGKGLRVPVLLTDGMPDWMAMRRRQLFDANAHRPHFAVVRDDAAHRRAVDAYEDRNKWLQDAWKNPSGQMQQAPDNSDPDGDEDDGETLSPRDEYIRRTSNMWREPIGNGYSGEADAVQAAFIARISPGGGARPGAEAEAIEAARRRRGTPGPPGVTFGQHNPSAFPSRDAASLGASPTRSLKDARAAADQAHAEYVARISNAWKAR